MHKNVQLAVIGGDIRQKYMIDDLITKGFSIDTYGINYDINGLSKKESLKEVMENKILICPIPFSRNKVSIFSLDDYCDSSIENFIVLLNNYHTIIGGLIPNKVTDYCINNNIKYYDLIKNNSFAYLNAISTAEGAISYAILNSKINLHLSKCLVLGYGRCAQVLAKKLHSLDAAVCVVARKKDDRSKAISFGLNAITFNEIKYVINKYDFIFNTVPLTVLKEAELCNISLDSTLIDIASGNGGFDYEICNKLKLNTNHILGLPGKISPKSSGKILSKVIEEILYERSGKCGA